MPYAAEVPIVRQIFMETALVIFHAFLIRNNILNPRSPYRQAFLDIVKLPKYKQSCGTVYHFKGNENTAEKIGQTMQPLARKGAYGEDFLPLTIINNECMNEELDQFCREKMVLMLETMKTHPNVPKPFQLHCDTLLATFNRGINQQLLAQLLEVGLQSFLGGSIDCPMECVGFHSETYYEQYEWVSAAAEELICDVLNTEYEKKSALLSWPPAQDAEQELLTKPVVVEAIGFKDCWSDAFKKPANVNASTQEERYQSDYTDEEKQAAFGEIHRFLHQAEVEKQLLLVDRCQSTLGGKNIDRCCDPKRRSFRDMAVQDHNLEFKTTIFGGEIDVHQHATSKSGVLTTKPLHVGGDAMTGQTSIEEATLRSMSAAAMQIAFPQLCSARPTVQQQQENKTTIHEASFQYQAMRTNLHQDGRVAAVVYKHCNTPPSVDALRRSGLKGWDNDHYIAANIRDLDSNTCGKDKNSERPLERALNVHANNILSWTRGKNQEASELHKDILDKIAKHVPAELQEEVKRIIPSLQLIADLFDENQTDAALASARWALFKEPFEAANTPACRRLIKIVNLARDVVLKKNAGNTQERRGQGTATLQDNNTEFTTKIPALLNDPENPQNLIWVRFKSAASDKELANIPEEVLNDKSFPHLERIAFTGVESKLKKRERMFEDSKKKKKKEQQGNSSSNQKKQRRTMKNNTQQFRSSDVLPQENKYSICKGRGARRVGGFILANIKVTRREGQEEGAAVQQSSE